MMENIDIYIYLYEYYDVAAHNGNDFRNGIQLDRQDSSQILIVGKCYVYINPVLPPTRNQLINSSQMAILFWPLLRPIFYEFCPQHRVY